MRGSFIAFLCFYILGAPAYAQNNLESLPTEEQELIHRMAEDLHLIKIEVSLVHDLQIDIAWASFDIKHNSHLIQLNREAYISLPPNFRKALLAHEMGHAQKQ